MISIESMKFMKCWWKNLSNIEANFTRKTMEKPEVIRKKVRKCCDC